MVGAIFRCVPSTRDAARDKENEEGEAETPSSAPTHEDEKRWKEEEAEGGTGNPQKPEIPSEHRRAGPDASGNRVVDEREDKGADDQGHQRPVDPQLERWTCCLLRSLPGGGNLADPGLDVGSTSFVLVAARFGPDHRPQGLVKLIGGKLFGDLLVEDFVCHGRLIRARKNSGAATASPSEALREARVQRR